MWRRLSVLFSVAGVAGCSSAESASPPSPPAEDAAMPVEDAGVETSTDAAPPPRKSSGGTGKLPCTRTDDANGRSVCVAKVGSVELKVVEPRGMEGAPLALGVYLHGDGAAAHKSASALKAMFAFADARHALVVSALAPNGCAWWQTPAHDCAGALREDDTKAENSVALDAALGAIERGWDVRADGRYYYGSSGGSIFLTDQWIPLHGAARGGVFALMCGGVAPTQKFGWDVGDAAARSRSSLAFTYGDKDFLLADIEGAIAAYKGRSFGVATKIVPGAEHCAFDAHGEAVAIWEAH